ncbi:MAG: M23 family metallopeptidase [Alicyclobacillaceae bacterium]|nr:M23 family metallopeptidase [Alicyclobacillaceae bacterium]
MDAGKPRRWPFDETSAAEGAEAQRVAEAEWTEPGSSVYGIADDDGSLRQAESSAWKPVAKRQPRTFVPYARGKRRVRTSSGSSRPAPGGRAAASDSTWVMQVAASCLLIMGAFYGLHGHTSLASRVHAAYEQAFRQDEWPAVSQAIGRFAVSHDLYLPALARQVGMSVLHSPLSHARLTDSYRPDSPEVSLSGSPGQPVLASGSGIVKQVSRGPGGTTVAIDHGSFATTWYVGLQHSFVKVGEYVTGGEVIGRLSSTRPTLRFGLQRSGHWEDPSTYVTFDGSNS